jgi:hypothetical protein
VALQLRFFKVESVLAADGRMTLKVWMRTSWTDERLRWNPDEWGGVTQLHFLGASLPAGAEVTEIWLPDVQPYNAFTGIHNTLDPAFAVVQSDGGVFFSRPGMLDVMCKFSGLAGATRGSNHPRRADHSGALAPWHSVTRPRSLLPIGAAFPCVPIQQLEPRTSSI